MNDDPAPMLLVVGLLLGAVLLTGCGALGQAMQKRYVEVDEQGKPIEGAQPASLMEILLYAGLGLIALRGVGAAGGLMRATGHPALQVVGGVLSTLLGGSGIGRSAPPPSGNPSPPSGG